MTEVYNPRRHGRTSETDPEDNNVREEWDYCHTLNAEHGGPGFTWVPTGSIYLRDDLQPRIESALDTDTARRYADAFDLLPPVLVQRGTLHLIDGRHRVRAAYLANPQRYYIKVVELDVPDEEMIDHAVKANVSHGRAHTQKERLYWAKDFLRRHPDWPDGTIAEWTGVGRTTVWELRGKDEVARATRERKRSDGSTYTVPETSSASVQGEHIQRQGVSPVEPETEDDSAPVITGHGTHVAGGKPAGFFPVGSQLYDMLSGGIVTLTQKSGQSAYLQRADGNTYVVDLVRDVRFALHVIKPVAEDPGPFIPMPKPSATTDICDRITALADAMDGVDPDAFSEALTEKERDYYGVLAAGIGGWTIRAFGGPR